jgi:hypothetical protein
MNLQHERILSLCDALNLPFIAQGYGKAAQDAAHTDSAYSDFLEGLLREEAAGRTCESTIIQASFGFTEFVVPGLG